MILLRKCALLFAAGLLVFCLVGAGAQRMARAQENAGDFSTLYLSRRPPLGPLHVVDVAGESLERKILAASLQGTVNRKSARIYLLDGEADGMRPWENEGDREAALFWLRHYREAYGIEPVWSGGLDDALALFADEVSGYVMATAAQPWTINAATVLAAREGLVVAFPSTEGRLAALGMRNRENLIGRWAAAADCYRELEKNYYHTMPHRGLAVLFPESYRLRDFLIQQGVLTIWSRPGLDDWDVVLDAIARLPANVPVFGFMSLTGVEEFLSVSALSRAGKFLIPTDTTANLSFHAAVAPPKVKRAAPAAESEDVCGGGLTVAVAISDGDNLVVPVSLYPRKKFWGSGKRGALPIGWSYSLALDALAPGIGAYYRSTASPNDELVPMLGIGYSLPTQYSDNDFFLGRSLARIAELGLSAYWLLDAPLLGPKAKEWRQVEGRVPPELSLGFLLGYEEFLSAGRPKAFRTPGGRPALAVSNFYKDGPQAIAEKIRKTLQLPAAKRPRVMFISAAVWLNPLDELAAALMPLEAEGVRFAAPSRALRCVAQ